MGLLRLALPTALVVWFLWKARGNPLFLLGIPVLMVMRASVFFDKMKPFWIPGRLDLTTLLMAWLFLAWLVIVVNHRSQPDRDLRPVSTGRLLPEELPLLGIALLIGWHALRDFGSGGDLAAAISAASATFSIVLGYVLVRGIVTRATRAQTEEFLAAVVIVNTVAAGLFFLHQGLHLPIYEGGANATYVFAGQDITRSTVFAPEYTLLALGYVLAKRAWSAGWLVVLAVTLLAVLVSYTRTLLVAAVAGVVIAVVARELSKPEASRFVRRAGTIVVVTVVVVVLSTAVWPAQTGFFFSRFSEFTSGGVAQVGNWQTRSERWDLTKSVVDKSDALFGLGFPRPGSNRVDSSMYRYSADMAWLPIFYRFGYAGLVLIGLALGGFMLRALRLSLRPPEERRHLALTYFITIALTVIMGFQMWTFMNPRLYPMGLMVLALVAAEALRPAEEPEAAPALAERPPPGPEGTTHLVTQ